MKNRQILLSSNEIPTAWYNLYGDIPEALLPVLHPGTGEPVTPPDLLPLFPEALIQQEVSTEKWIEIPEPIREKLAIWRPSPLVRATNLEEELKTPARIYFKNESVSPAGSHKPNTAVAQAYYNAQAGVKTLYTETGAGQWGSSIAFASSLFGLDCKVFMVRVSYEQKPYRRSLMHTWGAKVVPSPSPDTEFGRSILAKDPECTGSLGIAISEAVEAAVSDENARYSLGSVLNHVMLHQTIIGLEAKKQMEIIGEYPDIIIGCAGGGSNFAGLAFPFVRDVINGKQIEIYPVEPAGCPTLTKAPFVYDHGDTAKYTPLLPMHSLGHTFMPPPIHSGGLRYHGMAPTVSQLVDEGIFTPRSVKQKQVFEAGILLARTEGIIPAPETNHALAAVVEEALKAKEEGKEKVILFNWSGHGLLDLSAYENYLAGNLKDIDLSDEEISEAGKIYASHPKPESLKSR